MSKFPFEESFTEPVEMTPEEREESMKLIIEALSEQMGMEKKESIDESELPDEKVWDNFTRIQQKLFGQIMKTAMKVYDNGIEYESDEKYAYLKYYLQIGLLSGEKNEELKQIYFKNEDNLHEFAKQYGLEEDEYEVIEWKY